MDFHLARVPSIPINNAAQQMKEMRDVEICTEIMNFVNKQQQQQASKQQQKFRTFLRLHWRMKKSRKLKAKSSTTKSSKMKTSRDCFLRNGLPTPT